MHPVFKELRSKCCKRVLKNASNHNSLAKLKISPKGLAIERGNSLVLKDKLMDSCFCRWLHNNTNFD